MEDKDIKTHLTFIRENDNVDLKDSEIDKKLQFNFNKIIFFKNLDFLLENSFINQNFLKSNRFTISPKGEKYLQKLISADNYIAEKEKIEFEKSKIDLDLASKMLKDYNVTKWIARVGFFIALMLAVLEIIKYIKSQP